MRDKISLSEGHMIIINNLIINRQLQVQKILYENPEIQGDFLPLEQGKEITSKQNM